MNLSEATKAEQLYKIAAILHEKIPDDQKIGKIKEILSFRTAE